MGSFLFNIATQSVYRDIIAVVLGACVGSFLNVLALRTLAEQPFLQTVFGSSQCQKCKHRLGPLDLIPVLSYLMLNGKCRYCKERISWQYPIVEIVTAIAFIAVLYHFQISPREAMSIGAEASNAVAMDIAIISFFCILIAICITDFKEKLIPHEITYPAIVVGIAFSAFCRDDIMRSLAGVGISYVLFDFLAFYGLKLYYYTHQDDEGEEELERMTRLHDKDTLATMHDANSSHERRSQAGTAATQTDGPSGSAPLEAKSETEEQKEEQKDEQKDDAEDEDEDEDFDPQIDETFAIERNPEKDEDEEEFEVMGGGDAVLAALIAAWLGLENLGLTLLFGFMFGALMGSVYVAMELYKRGTLSQGLKKTGLIIGGLILLSEGTVVCFAYFAGMTHAGHAAELAQLPWLAMLAASTFGGILAGTIMSGKDASKPFPFGPALAAGAVVAVFMDPNVAHRIHLGESASQFAVFLRDMGHN